MLKIQITQKGAHLTVNDKSQEIPIGEILEFDTIPKFLVGKCSVISDTTDKEFAVNEKDELRAQYTELTGGKVAPGTWGVKKLTEEIDKLTAPE